MKVILHAGAGKTGSTAIQHFLSRNYEVLKTNGVLYPNPQENIINSGNSECILTYFESNNEKELKEFIMNQVKRAKEFNSEQVILSSEILPELDTNELVVLKILLDEIFIDVCPIIYVRNPYDWTYSAWMQHVKRHLVFEPFESYYIKIARDHLMKICRFINVFENSKVISYDSNKKRLIASFLEHANLTFEGLDYSNSETVVNRSLTEKEIDLMFYVNKNFSDFVISSKISDILINTYPNLNVSECTDETIKQHILSLNESELVLINKIIQKGEKIY